MNHKKTERIYREEGFALRRRSRRRRKASYVRGSQIIASYPNHVWSLDFVHDRLWLGRCFRTLNIIDEFTRESLAIEVDTSLGGFRVARVLDQLKQERGCPVFLRMDNGPEFTGKAMDDWASINKVNLKFIEPGKPVQNTWVESFNGRFREECLNLNWFSSLQEARAIIQKWREDYNQVRPHSSLNDLTPREFYKTQITKKAI